jgi:hypothetical protein
LVSQKCSATLAFKVQTVRTFIFLSVILFSTTLAAQNTATKYSFKQIGWTMMLPLDFKMLDSSKQKAIGQKGIDIIKESSGITVDTSTTKTLLTATKGSNLLTVTLIPFNTATDGDYNVTNQQVKGILYKTFADMVTFGKIDSSSSLQQIDGLLFNNYTIVVTVQDKVLLTTVLLSRYYKGYDFGISYLYLDEETKAEMESMLQHSKFDK